MTFYRQLLYWLILVSSANAVSAFDLTRAVVIPSQTPPQGTEVMLELVIATPQSPAFTYKQTEVVFSPEFNKFLVNVYPTDGIDDRFGFFVEKPSLGRPQLGDYVYEIQLHTQASVNWGRRIAFGTFSVVPPITVSVAGTTITVKWNAPSDYRLQVSENITDPASWRNILGSIEKRGDEYVWTSSVSSRSSFFRLIKPRPSPAP